MWTQTHEGHRYALALGSTRLEVDAHLGGRIIEFSVNGHNALLGLRDLGDWTNGGSTFWTSPQAMWGWPPDPILDRGRYEASFDHESLTLKSQPFTLAGARLTVSKRFRPDVAQEAVDIEYTVTNHGTPLTLAAWEISRVAATGLTFFAGEHERALNGLPKPLTSSDASGIVWLDHHAQDIEAKLGASATRGFIAYATPSILFVKTFASIGSGRVPAGEAEIELYVKPHAYVEIEQQSAGQELGTGEQLRYALKWFVRPMPTDIDSTVMNDRLARFAMQVGGIS
jgi:hypothetical protein